MAAALSVAATLFAQSNTGSIHGTVSDEHGLSIAGALVVLTGPIAPRTTNTDDQGVFRLLAVPPGQYSLGVTAPGFAAFTRAGVDVPAGKNTQFEVSLAVAAVAENVTVGGEASLLDSGTVSTGLIFSGEQLRGIPTSRNVWALLQQVPGVQVDMVDVAGNRSAVLGGPAYLSQGSGNVAYLVEGATTTDNTWGFWDARQNGGTAMYLDFSTLQEVNVVTGGSSLEQQTSGVTINVVTKRGTNELKGSARYLYASANWQSNNTPQQTIDLGLQSNSTRYIREYGGELGGPIWKDRIWAWAAGGRQDVSLNPATFNKEDVPSPDNTILVPWSAKLNGQISSANAAAFHFLHSFRGAYDIPFGSPWEFPVESRLDDLRPDNFYKLEDSNVFSSDFFAAVFLSYQDMAFSTLPRGGIDRETAYYDRSWHYTFYYYDGKTPQKQANAQVSRFFTTGSVSHELKLDFNYRQQSFDSTLSPPGSQNIGYEFPGETPYADLLRGVDRRYNMEYWTGALGDTLTKGQLALFLGLRYDLQRARNLPSVSFANQMFANPCMHCGLNGAGSFAGLPELKFQGADDWQFQYTNWQPRISATYSTGASKERLLRISYARFADQLGWIAPQLNGLPFINGYNYDWVDLNHDHLVQPDEVDFNTPHYQPDNYFAGIDPASLPDVPNTVDPGFKTPVTDEITAGVDRRLASDLTVSGTFTYRNTSHLQSSVPNGSSLSDYQYVGQARGVATGLDGYTVAFDLPYFNFTKSTSGIEILNRPGATQRYFGLDLSVFKRFSNSWTVRGTLGWNSFRQYLTPQSILDPNNGGQNDNGGPAVGYANWQFDVSGLYQGPWGLTFGLNFYGRQGNGNPSYVVAHTENGNDPWLLIGAFDSRRYPNVYQLDLRLQKTFQAGPLTLIPAAELFNATNGNPTLRSDQSVGDYSATTTDCVGGFCENPNYGLIGEVQSPRILRLSLQILF